MASVANSTGLLPFLRGADLSYNDFREDNCPQAVNQMRGLKWLKLDRTRLDSIPESLNGLDKLEKLDLSHNNLSSLYGELICLDQLKFLNCRHNQIHDTSIPHELFKLKLLSILDLSHNRLKVIPHSIFSCKSLRVLNLSHNLLSNIDDELFKNLLNLTYIDLSFNQLKTVPPQLGRLSNLITLILNDNPLEQFKMRQLERLKSSLQSLHLANTQRDITINSNAYLFGDLTNLVQLDLSSNDLSKVPDDLVALSELKRLNISNNLIEKLPEDFGCWWPKLETINLSRNKLHELPSSLCKLSNLKRLYVTDNRINFDGLPAALGKLIRLEVFMAARNNLESIPESIFRCVRLKKLILTSNRLITLPDTIHLLNDLEILELSDNPDLVMPPKPASDASKNNEFYNIDFSLSTQLRLAGNPNSAKLPQPQKLIKDSIARKLRLRKRAEQDLEQEESNQKKVLEGLQKLAMKKDGVIHDQSDSLTEPKRWMDCLEGPSLDYRVFFDETTGQFEGISIWEIENFCPVLIDPGLYEDFKFHDADCYIVLSTEIDENLTLNWNIYYWIGSNASLDKKACSAIHAVNLRNHLKASCRTIREELGEESDEFRMLFPDKLTKDSYVKGARTSSGFYIVEDPEYDHKLFRLHEVAENAGQLHLERVSMTVNSFDSRFVFLLDAGTKIFIWTGSHLPNRTIQQKAGLLAEKLNKEERKNKSELITCQQGDEPTELLEELNLKETLKTELIITEDLPKNFRFDTYQPRRPILYKISIGTGFIELLQVNLQGGKLLTKYLIPTNVYVLDCLTDIFVWWGRKSPRLVRNGALKLAQELKDMILRPDFATITSCLQGTESQLFKSKFRDWDNVIAVDYTRTAESVSKTGANLTEWMSNQKVKFDLASLFSPRPTPLTEEEAQILIEDWNDESKLIGAFYLDKNRRFAKLPEEEYGHFYTEDCYVFLYRYSIIYEDSDGLQEDPPENDGDEEARLPNGVRASETNLDSNDDPGPEKEEFKFVGYFWQGRDASKMGWLTFTFGLQKKFEALFGDKLEVMHMHQQQENLKFLAHFEQKFIIHQGKRKTSLPTKPISLYHLRSNSNPLTLRCIEIEPDSSKLNSGFCFIIRLIQEPSNQQSSITSSKLYIWIGSKSIQSERDVAKSIAEKKFNLPPDSELEVITIDEGEEHEEFWNLLNGKQDYDTDVSFMQHTRLFRCSNDKGYFSISEKYTDFCQDDLSDDDIMILDNGSQVFLWVGSKSSEVEVKLAYKSAQVYVQNLRVKEGKQRQLMLTLRGKESKKFTKCFHAWSSHKEVKDPRGDEAVYLRQAFFNQQESDQP